MFLVKIGEADRQCQQAANWFKGQTSDGHIDWKLSEWRQICVPSLCMAMHGSWS